MVDYFFEEVREALERGEDVKLSGFGIFNLRESRSALVATRNRRGNP